MSKDHHLIELVLVIETVRKILILRYQKEVRRLKAMKMYLGVCWAPTTPPIFLQNVKGPHSNPDNYNELQNQPFQTVSFLGLL
jgi:hypothetical protein